MGIVLAIITFVIFCFVATILVGNLFFHLDDKKSCLTCVDWARNSFGDELGFCSAPVPDSVLNKNKFPMKESEGTECPCYKTYTTEVIEP